MILTVRTPSEGCYWVARDEKTQIVTYGDTDREAMSRNRRAVEMRRRRLVRRKEAES